MTKELIVSSNSHESTVALLEDDQLVEIYIARGAQHGLAGSIYKGRVTRVLPGMQSAFVNIGLDRDAFLYVSDFVSEMEDMDEGGAEAAVQAIENAAAKAVEVVTAPPAPAKPGAARPVPAKPASAEPAPAEPARPRPREREAEPNAESDRGRDRDPDGRPDRRGRRSRRRRGRGGRFPDSKYARVDEAPAADGQPSEVGRPEPDGRPEPAARPEDRRPEDRRPEVRRPDRGRAPEPEERRRGAEPEDRRPAAAESGDDEFIVLPGESLAKYSGPAGGRDSRQPREAEESEGGDWSDAAADERDRLDASGEDDDAPEVLARPDFSQRDDEANGRFGRGRRDFDEAIENEDSAESLEAAGDGLVSDNERFPEDDPEIAAAEASAGDEDDPDAENEAGPPELAAADEDSEDSLGTTTNHMVLDAFETAEVREALREAIEEDAAGENEADAEEEDEAGEEDLEAGEEGEAVSEDGQQPGEPRADGRATEGREDGPRNARVRGGRGGSSRYVHRRGGRRGRRRGRPQGMQDPVETESAADEAPRSSPTSITELLNPGQEILVQISKEPLGKKGARITSHIAMPGRYLVYMPTVEHVGVSRKIANDTERLRLRRIVQAHRTGMPGGFIVRTAGSGASEEEVRGDMLFLYNLWLDIRQKAEQRPAPSLIHQDLDIVERVLRDQLGSDFKTMWVDSEGEYERILRFVERFQPELLSRVKLYTRSKPVFDAFNITPELEKALRPKVWLKSGGYIVINQTEALVAIDVNTGKFVGKSDRLEDTIVKTNLEAVQEIVRQIRLRDLGGIIVVDFIDMDDRKNRYQVAQALEQELRLDRAPSKSLQFNEFGLVAITRKRVKQSLERTLCTPCPYCTGSGFVKSVDTVIFEILNEAKKMAPRVRSRKDLTVRVNPEVARALKSRENSYLQEIEEIFRANVLIRGDVTLHREHFDIN